MMVSLYMILKCAAYCIDGCVHAITIDWAYVNSCIFFVWPITVYKALFNYN